MKIDELGDVVILIRVAPNGTAEAKLMKHLEDIKEATNYTSLACQLHELFGWKDVLGQPYNQYELDFDSEHWLLYAFDFLKDWFVHVTLDSEFDLDNEKLPEVVYVRRTIQ